MGIDATQSKEVAKMPNHARLPALRSQVRNRILLALPEHEFQHVFRNLAFVALRQGQVLYNADNWIDYVYFINSGMSSSVTVTSGGQILEDGTVGYEGLMGGEGALGEGDVFCSGVVQIPGTAMRIGSQALKHESQHNAGLSKLLLDYTVDLHFQVDQSTICNGSHSLEQRLCRLLLISQDYAQSSSFPFTFEFLSHMVGTTRATASDAVEALRYAGLISCRRSRIRIIDSAGIKGRGCRCYQIVARKCDQLAAHKTTCGLSPRAAEEFER
jgi:CRP-like cAMP-binding protein